MALEQLAQHHEWVHALLARGGDIAAQDEERLRAGQRSPAAGNLLLQLHHPQVALGQVVVKGDARVVQGPQDLTAMGIQPGQQVGRGYAAWLAPAAAGGWWGWVGRLPVGDEPLVAAPEPAPRLVVHPAGAGGA